MARRAVSMQAGCLLALLACAAVVAAADRDAGKKQTATAGAQQYGGEHYGEHDEGHDNYQHSDEHYSSEKTEVKTLYLQETGAYSTPERFTRRTFRCAKESDAADACLKPSYGYDQHRQYDADESEDLLSDITGANHAAVCITGRADVGQCPTVLPEWADCVPWQMNCTISKQAAECGCPYADGLQFTSSGYIFYTNASSCSSNYNLPVIVDGGRRGLKTATYGYGSDAYNSNATIYTGIANIVATHIEYVQTSYGYKEVKGKLQFVRYFDTDLDFVRASRPSRPDANVQAKAASYPFDERNYDRLYRQKQRDYANEDRYYEDTHHDGGYDGDDSYYSSRPHPKNLVKGGALKITLLEKQYY